MLVGVKGFEVWGSGFGDEWAGVDFKRSPAASKPRRPKGPLQRLRHLKEGIHGYPGPQDLNPKV